MFIFTLIGWKYTLKPILIFMLLWTSIQNYFMVTYNILVDQTMIENILQTDSREVLDLLNIKLILYVLFLGIFPAWIVFRIQVNYGNFKESILSKGKNLIVILFLIWGMLFIFSKYYTSFFREHKVVRFYINPLDGFFCFATYLKENYLSKPIPFKYIGTDAVQGKKKKRDILILVVGEAARADHFSLNGYTKNTNPLLKKENIINFSEVSSCGTTTAVSIPCMFSSYKRTTYNSSKGRNSENVLDVLNRAGVKVLWRDNNSDSKGVAVRLNYISYKTKKVNSICDIECRDIGMLDGLDKEITSTNKDMIIVLHQMGNHGPAYYKRYPTTFERFKPTCQNNQLEYCSEEEISNSYDNALLYTDYFLSKVIQLLKKYDNKNMESSMIYLSDHGESLGEKGLYLHGLPYFIAPSAQTKIPMVMWFSRNHRINIEELGNKKNNAWSHDNLFATLLGLFHVKSVVYKKEDDILNLGDL